MGRKPEGTGKTNRGGGRAAQKHLQKENKLYAKRSDCDEQKAADKKPPRPSRHSPTEEAEAAEKTGHSGDAYFTASGEEHVATTNARKTFVGPLEGQNARSR